MLKDKFLIPFFNGNINKMKVDIFMSKQIKLEDILNFLKLMDDEDIKKIGNSIAFLYPSEILSQFTNKININKTFSTDFRKEYGLDEVYNIKVKKIGLSLIESLRINKNLTPKDFIRNEKL